VAAVIAGQPGLILGSDTHPATVRAAYPAGTTVPQGGTAAGPQSRRRGPGRRLLAIGAAGIVAAAAGTTLALVLASRPAGSSHATGQTTPTRAAVRTATSAATSAAASSPPASTPAASPSASPTNSLIAVTVCTFPADGCTQPGAAQYMEVRPDQITDSGDGSGYVKDLVWADWGSPQATARGTEEVNNCSPNCATGTFTGYPATVTLAGLKPYGTGLEAYSTIVIESPAANLTETYTTGTVP
jgi:hypothetical protein